MKVLFITYYWPPAGGVSAQRILHFVKNLSELGVTCHVIHPKGASYYQVDSNLEQLITPKIVLHPVAIQDITSLVKKVPKLNSEGNIKSESKGIFSKLSKWLRANLFIPDPKANWVSPVVSCASSLITKEKFDLVFTNGTPHSVHLAGLKLKKHFSIPWVADFRDPWTNMDYFSKLPLTKRSLKKHKYLESLVIQNADVSLTVSKQWKKDFEALGAKRAEYITNGYDEAIEAKPNKTDFLISHVGSLHGDRNLGLILDALALLIKKETADHKKIKLALVGNVSASTIQICKNKLSAERLILPGIVDHSTSKEWIGKSNVLLLPINHTPDAAGRIPAKLFEYLSSNIPIIVLGTKTGDAAEIVQDIKAGKCFNTGDENALISYLEAIKQHEIKPTNHNKDAVEKYSRMNKAKELKVLLESLI